MQALRPLFLVLFLVATTVAQDDSDTKKTPEVGSSILGGLKFRTIGPAMISGRISDFAVTRMRTRLSASSVISSVSLLLVQ